MTLILSVITPHYAMQASDRRVTRFRDGQLVGWDDTYNKAIFVAERLSFALTGAADIDGDSVEFFAAAMARNLGYGRPVEEALQRVGKMCEQQLAQRGSLDDERLTFVGVGWTDVAPSPRSPVIVWISNSIGPDGKWCVSPASFETGIVGLGEDEPLAVVVSGVGLSARQTEDLNRDLLGEVMASNDPAPVAEVLMHHTRRIAEENELVGPGVMVNNLPFASGSPTGDVMFIGGPPQQDVRTFTYASADLSSGAYLGPHIVGGDGTRMEGFEAYGQPGTFGFSYGSHRTDKSRRSVVGQRINESKIGRNEPCWCGSGRKFKRCHGR